jgi:hypothetical protein
VPDQKISDLVDGAPPQDADEYVIARAGSNFSLSYGAMTAGASSSLSGVGAVTVATNGNTISIGAPAQSVQTQNLVAVTLSGNTAGVLALASSGTVTLAGGNNITLSQAGNAITISGPNVGGAQTGISGIANSETTYTSGTVSLSEQGALTIRSTTGQQFQFSVPATSSLSATGIVSVSTNGSTISIGAPGYSAGISTLGNTSGDTGYASQRLNLVGGNNITLSGSTNGGSMSLTISGPNVGGAQTGISGIVGSDATYTSGTVTFTGVGGGVTVNSNTGQRIDISVAAQSVQPETQTFIAGISASDTLYTSGNVRFTGSQAVTVRSGTGQLVVIDAPAQSVQPETQTFIAGISASDTLYTSGNVRFTGVGGGITVSSNTGQRVDLSVAAPVAATNLSVGVSTGGNTAGDTGVATGSRFVIVGSNGITASQGTAAGATTVTLSGITQSVQTQGGFVSLGVSTGGNTAGNTQVSTGSRFVLVASGNLTASQATAAGASTVTLSVAAQSVQPETQTFIGGISASDTNYTSGTVRFTGSNMITVKSSGAGQTVIIDATQTVQTQGVLSAGVSNVGNTSGNTTVNTGSRLVFAGGNNITLSQGTAAGATTITISAPNLGAGAMSAGVSNLGNSAGATGITGTQLVLVGSDNITLSQTTGANGGTVSIIGPAAGGFSAGVSTGGNTAGDTGVTGTRLVMVGVSPISLSQATAAAGGTVSINAPATSSLSGTGGIQISTNGSTISIGHKGTVADWQNFPMGQGALMTLVAGISKTPFYFPVELNGYLTANSLAFRGSMVTANTLLSMSVHLGVYTFVNSTSAALLGSHSEAYVVSSATSVSLSGVRNFVMTGIGTHATLSSLSAGKYIFGMMFSAGATASMNMSLFGAATGSGPLGVILPGTNNVSAGTSQGVQALYGRGSTTVNAMPANIVRSELVNQGSGASMQLNPWIYIRS